MSRNYKNKSRCTACFFSAIAATVKKVRSNISLHEALFYYFLNKNLPCAFISSMNEINAGS